MVTVHIQASITNIGTHAFAGSGLMSVTFEDKSQPNKICNSVSTPNQKNGLLLIFYPILISLIIHNTYSFCECLQSWQKTLMSAANT